MRKTEKINDHIYGDVHFEEVYLHPDDHALAQHYMQLPVFQEEMKRRRLRLSLYEHQSTYNPNLPLRFLIYISQLYSGMTRNKNLYGTKTVQIPPPEFIIFYNGEKDMPEKKAVRLSDMYRIKVKDPKLELEALMLNISGKNNSRLKDACRALKDYAVYTDKIRLYTKSSR